MNQKGKLIYLILTTLFVILTFIGAGYVIYNKGETNPGIAVVPSLFAIIFSNLYRNSKKDNK